MGNSTTSKLDGKQAVLAKARKFKQKHGVKLLVHASGTWGRWARKINQKLHYFGQVDPAANDFGAAAAVALYDEQREDLEAGRVPRPKVGGITVADVCNSFLTAKDAALERGEIVQRTRIEYSRTTDRIVKCLGKDRPVDDLRADDFAKFHKHLATGRGAHAQANEIRRTRSVFKYAFDAELIERPVRLGPMFKAPPKKIMRQLRNLAGKRMFEPFEIHLLLASAGTQMRAMILIAANTGFGNADVGLVPLKALDLEGGWVDFPRPKTAVQRRCPLWPETIEAINAWLAKRPNPKDRKLAGRLFITKYGGSWHKDTFDSPVSNEFAKIMTSIDESQADEARKKQHPAPGPIYRKGRGFYALRHGFQTVGDGAKDPIATQYIMGHAESDSDMSARYREGIDDDRLQAVVEHVRQWLWPEGEPVAAAAAGGATNG